MNDLFSSSFKKCNEQKHHPYPDDVEAGKEETINLDKFFEDVENIKEDMRTIDKLHKRLHDSKEECTKAHSAAAMKDIRSRMDTDVSHVLKTAKFVKGKLEALERSNSANRNVPGCGPGSSADRTRSSVVGGMAKKLKTTMDDFQRLRANISAEYKDTVGRRYFTVTGERADEETVEKLIESGAGETFMQKAIQDQGRGQIMDAICEIQERHGAVKEIEKNLVELHQVFMDMAALVDAQGQHLNNIESHVAHASSFVRRGTEQLQQAKEIQKGSRKWTCIAICIGSCVVAVILFPLLTNTMMLANLGFGPK